MKRKFRTLFLIFIIANMLFLCSCNKSNNTDITSTTQNTDSSIQTTSISTDSFNKYVVTAEMVNIRKDPNLESEILDCYYKNTLIESTPTDDPQWNKVKLSENEFAFVYAEFVSPISDSDYETYLNYQIKNRDKQYGVINNMFVDIYALPTTDSDIIATYRKNDTIEILSTTQNDWYIINHNDFICYIPLDCIKVLSSSEYYSYTKEPLYVGYDKDSCEIIGTYSTNYYYSKENSKFNIEKAANQINGLIIPYNRMFNWCRDIGPCGEAEGYLSSTEIVNGEYVEGYGGGICQVSSTLCAAVIQTGTNIEFIDRNKHSIAPTYIPQDLDATVSYPDCNFIFRNNNPFSIMIEAIYTNDYTLTINIYKVEKLFY